MIDGRRRGTAAALHGGGGTQRRGLGAALYARGVRPDHVTIAGICLAGVGAWTIATGRLWFGVALVTVSGLTDLLDGAIARARGTYSARGAFFDSVADRAIDTLLFGGTAWYLASGRHPRDAFLAIGVLAAGYLVSYQRAKAESIGLPGKGGLMERAERLVMLGVGLGFDGFWLVPWLWALLGLTCLTVAQRFVRIWRAAGAEDRRQAAGDVLTGLEAPAVGVVGAGSAPGGADVVALGPAPAGKRVPGGDAVARERARSGSTGEAAPVRHISSRPRWRVAADAEARWRAWREAGRNRRDDRIAREGEHGDAPERWSLIRPRGERVRPRGERVRPERAARTSRAPGEPLRRQRRNVDARQERGERMALGGRGRQTGRGGRNRENRGDDS